MSAEPIREQVRTELANVAAQLHWTEKLEVLDYLGWSTAVVTGLAGQRLILGKQRGYPHMEVRAQADSIEQAATDYFWEALTVGGTRDVPVTEH